MELKPCPFCGAKEESIDYGHYDGTLRGRGYVECMECGALITAESTVKAIEAWNRRAE